MIINGEIIDRLVEKDSEGNSLPKMTDVPFFKSQVKITLRNCGVIDPLNIDDYIARDGYQALAKALYGDGS